MISHIELNATHIMVDLETMSTAYNAAIVSIGAVAVKNGEVLRTFESTISLESSMANGLHVSASTVMWWMQQSEHARQALQSSNDLRKTLQTLNEWAEPLKDPRVWGNGATFDNVILRNAYNVAGLKPFWQYKHDRCYRTFKDLIDPQRRLLPREGATAHTALADAVDQMYHLQKMFAYVEDNCLLASEDGGK
jgi:DNA polymerase III alpha subunit (gram-positive type)